jgi:hypothetical protein
MTVTLPLKRYIRVCAGCDLLFPSARIDQVTCSPACRVRAHRSGRLRRLREQHRTVSELRGVSPALALELNALMRLCPNISHRIVSENPPPSADEWRRAAWEAFWEMLERDRL